MRRLSILLACATVAGCEPRKPSEVRTVPYVDARVDALNGQRISVAGYLGDCMGYECELYASKADHDAFERWAALVTATRTDVPLPALPSIGIGSGDDGEFDRIAQPFTRSYVVITGTVTNRCRYKGVRACTDRSPDVEPAAIRAADFRTKPRPPV